MLVELRGQGQPWPDPTGPGPAEHGLALRASKNGLDPAWPSPWTVYPIHV